MVEGYRGPIFYQQFEVGSQEGKSSREKREVTHPTGASEGVEEKQTVVGMQEPEGADRPSVEDTIPGEGGFIFGVFPSSFSREVKRNLRRMRQRKREVKHGGNDHSPGPNNPSEAK